MVNDRVNDVANHMVNLRNRSEAAKVDGYPGVHMNSACPTKLSLVVESKTRHQYTGACSTEESQL